MKRSSIVVIVLALLAVLAGAWFLFWPHVKLPADPMAAVPADSYGVVHIRVDRVLASDAYKRLIVERGQAKGIERVQVMCGFNPLARLTELTVFARPAPGGGLPKLAFAARGDLNHDELIDCVKKFTKGDESSLVRDDIEGIPAVHSPKGSSRAAFVGRDGIIGGDADSVAAAIHTVLQKAPSLAGDALMKGMYDELVQGSDVTVVSRLPEEAKPMIQQLALVAGPRALLLEKIKLFGLTVNTASARIAGGATLLTSSPDEAAAFVELGKGAIQRVLQIPGIGMTPAYGVLKTIQTEVRGDRATFSGQIKVATIETLLELAPALQEFAGDMVPGTKPGGAAPAPNAPVPTVEPLKVAPAAQGANAAEPEPKKKRSRSE